MLFVGELGLKAACRKASGDKSACVCVCVLLGATRRRATTPRPVAWPLLAAATQRGRDSGSSSTAKTMTVAAGLGRTSWFVDTCTPVPWQVCGGRWGVGSSCHGIDLGTGTAPPQPPMTESKFSVLGITYPCTYSVLRACFMPAMSATTASGQKARPGAAGVVYYTPYC